MAAFDADAEGSLTAEIVILNRSAIALAADSAFTVQSLFEDGTNQRIYTTSNKLFMLSKFNPLGIMIYGNADLLRVPWEVIIKMYRSKLYGSRFPTVKDYAMDFIEFLEGYFLKLEQERHFNTNLTSYYRNVVLREINARIDDVIDEYGEIEYPEVKKIVDAAVKERLANLINLPRLSVLPEDFAETIIDQYEPLIKETIAQVFEKLPVSRAAAERLVEIAGCLFSREVFPDSTSGVVITGFGENETFPSVFAFTVEGVVNENLIYRVDHDTAVTPDRNALVIPFDQQDMVETFLGGIDPSISQLLDGYLAEIFTSYPQALLDILPQMPDQEKLAWFKTLARENDALLKRLREDLANYEKQVHTGPILTAVSVLPKDELAVMAEALVQLASFKRRVTLGSETVKGPIDVAVISKGDGFVWIKRKDYFPPDLNQHFFNNFYRDHT